MSGIDSGILVGAKPLTAAQIKELEERTLNYEKPVAFLNEEADLCFFLTRDSVDGLKDIAWHNAYELYADNGTFFKKAFIKTGLDTYDENGLFSKTTPTDVWQEVVQLPPATDPKYLRYCLDETYNTGGIQIYGYITGLPEVVVIPDVIDGTNVTVIDAGSFAFSSIKQLYLAPAHTITLKAGVCQNCYSLSYVYIGTNITRIESRVFQGCSALQTIEYAGTAAQWKAVTKGANWNYQVPATYVKCSDGKVDMNGNVSPLDGDGQEYYTTAPAMLSFRSQEPLDEFQEVLVNGEVVDPSNYELEEGSTIVKLSTEYLKTLPAGDYNIEVVSKNAAPTGTFTVTDPGINEYGFYYDQPYSTPYDEETGDASAFILHTDGTMDVFAPNNMEVVATNPYIYDSGYIIVGEGEETLPLQITNNGRTLAIEDIEFNLCGGDWMYADAEYFYHLTADPFGSGTRCYLAAPYNKNKDFYGPTVPNVNGTPVILFQTYLNMGVTSVVIADGIETTFYACAQCPNLKTVSIPASVKSLRYSFSNSDNLETIYYNGTVDQWAALSGNASIKNGVTVYCVDGTITTD